MEINWAKLGGNPLVTFFRRSLCYTYCDDGTLSLWNAAGTIPSQLPPPVDLLDVDRVIFHDNDVAKGSYLLGFNVVGEGKDSWASFRRGSLVFTTSIRCLLQSDKNFPVSNLGAAVSLRAEFGTERLNRFWLSHSTLIDTTGVSSVDLISPATGEVRPKTLKKAISDIADGKTAPVQLGKRNSMGSTEYSEINTTWSTVLNGLLSENPGKTSIERGGELIGSSAFQTLSRQKSLNVAFRRGDLDQSRFLIQFEASFEKARAEGIKCFAIARAGAPESEAQFELDQDGTWYLWQRSSVRSCITASREELETTVPAEWMLELQCLSYESTADRFNNRWTKSGQRGIRDFAGASGTSFLPSLAKGVKFPFTAVYQIADRVTDRNTVSGALWDPAKAQASDGKVSVHPLSVQYVGQPDAGGTASALFDFPLCETTDRQPLQVSAQLNSIVFSNRDQWSGFILSSENAWASSGRKAVRMGSLELGFGQRAAPSAPPKNPSYFRLYDQGAGPQLTVSGLFVVTKILPGGQDDLPEDSFFAANTVTAAMPVCRTGVNPSDTDPADMQVERSFYRPRPLLINRPGIATDFPLLLAVSEESGPAINRTVRLSIGVDPGAQQQPPNPARQQAIVIDADPFLVAQISFPSLLSQVKSNPNQIATWDNAGGDGSKWQIPLTSTGFSLTLPAQAVGEDMVKNKDFSLPADFRIGPPAVVAMESGVQGTNYAEVPWNLRRLLGYAGQPLPGVAVDRLDYELLYGLSCDVSQPFVRLAEVFALLGSIPGRLPQLLAASDPQFDEDRYRAWRVEWAALHQRYQARLAILEPWDNHVAGSLSLKHGMSCVIRYKVDPSTQQSCSQTLGGALLQFAPDASTEGRPFRLPSADLDDPITPQVPKNPLLLQGGVTWGFESRNVFCATLRNEFSTTDSAAVSDFDITALGGFGHQQASFDEGRTSIFGDAAMGRTYFYKLERVGRVGVFWNKAKHVIVYERSVVPSRQFYQEQGANDSKSYGIPMLRKVDEYVEILEEERRFPDDHLLTTTTGGGAATPAQRCGCVAACVFQKGARIKVSSAWGSDVNSRDSLGAIVPIGWKVPLWKRGATPADVYPLPKVSLSLFSDFGGSSKESPCDIANPEIVYFYTDTREGTGSDSDKWGAIIGVDTVNVAPVTPAKIVGVLPTIGDVPVPAGFSICTFKLFPPLKPTDVVANRVGTPMAAVLDTVTMSRGCTVANPVPSALQSLLSTYSTAWDGELSKLAETDWTKAKLQVAADKVTAAIKQKIADAQRSVTGAWTANWQTKVSDYNSSAIGRLSNQLLKGTADGKAITGGIEQVKLDVQAGLAQIQSGAAGTSVKLRQLVDEQFGSIQKAVLDASATPGVLSSILLQYYTAARSVVDKAAAGVPAVQGAFAALPAAPTPEQARDAVAKITKQILDLKGDLTAAWTAAGSARPIPELADIADGLSSVAGPLQNFTTQYRVLIDALTNSINDTASDYAAKLVLIKGKVGVLKSLDSVKGDLDKFATTLKAGFKFKIADAGLVTYLDCFRSDLTQYVTGTTTWATTTYDALKGAALTGDPKQVQTAFNNAYTTFNDRLTSLQTDLNKETDSLGADMKAAVSNIQAAAAQSLSDLKSALDGALQNLPANIGMPDINGIVNLQDIADMKQAVLRFRDEQFAEAHQYVDKYVGLLNSTAAGAVGDITANTNQLLSLVRAFGDAPVADTLSFLPGKIGYYFQESGLPTQVDLSPVTSILRQAGNLASDASGVLNNALNVMHLQVPTTSLADRLVPPDLSKLKLSDIFPKFAGIDLSNLFKDINLNEDGGKIHISHGTDPQTTSAWVQADIGAHMDNVPVFDTGGVSLVLATADFTGQVRIDVSPQGTRQSATGSVLGDWKLLVLGDEAVTLTGTQLIFDNSGKLRFIVQPKNIQLPGVVAFVTQYLAPFMGGDNGLSVQIKGTQVNALLNLPIPDMQGLTSGISNLRLSCLFGIGLNSQSQFQLDVGFGLSEPERPFNVAFFILGGAGYLQATTHFVPSSGKGPTCTVDFGIMASASLAIAFGPISGGVYAFMGITASFTTGGPGLSLSAVLLIRGQVNLAGIISASVVMELSVTDEAGKLTGRGYFSISVSICWCFTLHISVDISYSIGSAGGQQQTTRLEDRHANRVLLASLSSAELEQAQSAFPAPGADVLSGLINDYTAMTKGF